MPASRSFQRWGGTALMIGNVLFIVNKLNEMSRLFISQNMPDVISGQNLFLILLGQITLILGFIAYYQLYLPRVDRFGKHALRFLCGGGVMLALGHVSFMSALLPFAEAFFLLVFAGLLFLLIGLLWFGILNLRQPVQTRWKWLPLITGLMGFIGFVLFRGQEITAIFLFFRTLFALGLIALGLAMWLEPVQSEGFTTKR